MIIARILSGDTAAVRELDPDPLPQRPGNTLCSDYTGPRGSRFIPDCSNPVTPDSMESGMPLGGFLSSGPFVLPEDGTLFLSLTNLGNTKRFFDISVLDLAPPAGRTLNIGGTELYQRAAALPGEAVGITWSAAVPAGVPVELRIAPSGFILASVMVTFSSGTTSVLFRPGDWISV
jgi:hypothetical protein